jgi:hypothetical protein
MLPCVELVFWLSNATRPANTGAPTEVPPKTVSVLSDALYPFTQLPWEQTRYPSWSGDAAKVTSGTSRLPSEGTPNPTCQAGLENILLTPPPLAESDPPLAISVAVSFQVVSGIYETAEPLLLLLVEFQKVPDPSLKVLPPMAVT